MENQITQMVQVRVGALQLSLPKTSLDSFPKKLRLEVNGTRVSESNPNQFFDLVNRILRLLGVKNDDSQKEFTAEWIRFVAENYKNVTLEEIYESFQMAIKGDLRNESGEIITMYQKLDNISTGKVIKAYLELKKQDVQYNSAKTKLVQEYLNPKKELTKEDLTQINDEYFQMIISEIKLGKDPREIEAWLLYDDYKQEINTPIEEKRMLFEQEKKLYNAEIKAKMNTNRLDKQLKNHLNKIKDSNKIINDRCKSLIICNYLKEKYNLNT